MRKVGLRMIEHNSQMLIQSSRRRQLEESIDVTNYRIEVVLTFLYGHLPYKPK